MVRCLGDYPLRLFTRNYNGQKFNHRRASWYDVFEEDLSRENLSNANFPVEHIEENLLKVKLSKVKLSASKENMSKENLSASAWIIPSSLRNNDNHYVFI